ncbi:MAG TPA: hypothetical protein EYH59_04205 [Pyrodictium sp.]|nr:hypothetical protein [Pyrodictium sp.]
MSLQSTYSLVIKPLHLASFRWGGSFTPLVTGPAAIAFSEPLPMPSTIAGLLAGEALGYKPSQSKVSPEELEKLIAEKLGFGDRFALRGPYIYDGDVKTVYLHYWSRSPIGKRLVAVELVEGKMIISFQNIDYHQHTGIALNNTCKSVIRGLIYTQMLAKQDKSIIVEVHGANKAWPNGKIVRRFGGEGRIAIIERMDTAPLFKLITSIKAGNGWYAYVVTPILLPPHSINEIAKILEGRDRMIDVEEPPNTRILIPTLKELKDFIEVEEQHGKNYIRGDVREKQAKIAKRFRTKITLLSPGYDMAANMPRPLHLAIMPGSIVKIETPLNPQQLYQEGVGLYRRLGWGTLLPLPQKLVIKQQ